MATYTLMQVEYEAGSGYTLSMIDCYPDFDEAKASMTSLYGKKVEDLYHGDNGEREWAEEHMWMFVDDLSAYVEDEFDNKWKWFIFDSDAADKTFFWEEAYRESDSY